MKNFTFFLFWAGVLVLFVAASAEAQEVAGGDILQVNNLLVQNIEGVATSSREGILSVSLSDATTTPTACVRFETLDAETKTSVACPQFNKIFIKKDTSILLKNRARAKLTDFENNDQINTFGFYSTDGTLRAVTVRNLSKPKEIRSTQLSGVQLIALLHASATTELVVIQEKSRPCHSFLEGRDAKESIPCPDGLPTLEAYPASQNVKVPASLFSLSETARKYIIAVDDKTAILDRNRNRLLLSDFSVEDAFNVFGRMERGGTILKAEIIRNVTKPATAASLETFRGVITQLNIDGSLTLKTDDGRTFTVPNAIGGTIKVRGILDSAKKVIRQIAEIIISPPPVSDTALISLTTKSHLEATIENEYYGVFEANGGTPDYFFSVTDGSLPPGLYLASPPTQEAYCPSVGSCIRPKQTTILVRGTPTKAGTYEFTLTARDQQGSTGTRTIRFVIKEPVRF